jgi:hypothetical protein
MLKSCDVQSQLGNKKAARKKRVLMESELKRVLEYSGSDFDDVFFGK